MMCWPGGWRECLARKTDFVSPARGMRVFALAKARSHTLAIPGVKNHLIHASAKA